MNGECHGSWCARHQGLNERFRDMEDFMEVFCEAGRRLSDQLMMLIYQTEDASSEKSRLGAYLAFNAQGLGRAMEDLSDSTRLAKERVTAEEAKLKRLAMVVVEEASQMMVEGKLEGVHEDLPGHAEWERVDEVCKSALEEYLRLERACVNLEKVSSNRTAMRNRSEKSERVWREAEKMMVKAAATQWQLLEDAHRIFGMPAYKPEFDWGRCAVAVREYKDDYENEIWDAHIAQNLNVNLN